MVDHTAEPSIRRWALGIEYDGQGSFGWQSQPHGQTIQDHVEHALSKIACEPISVICAGRTDTGVHALNQVIHFDTHAHRLPSAWIRGVNRHLPNTIRVLWAKAVDLTFHARFLAIKRSYRYILYNHQTRPGLYHGKVGWIHDALDEEAIRKGMSYLVGRHDFSAFRSSQCQAKTPIKTMYRIALTRKDDFWCFTFEASGFLHHMVRNIMGSLLAVGKKNHPPEWMHSLLNDNKNRCEAAATFSAAGLYFVGAQYPDYLKIPQSSYLPFE